MDIVKTILWQFFILLVCTGSVVTVLLGIAMLLGRERAGALSHYLARWVSPADKVTEQLDRPRWIERYFYRHHRLFGSAVFIGSVFVQYVFLFKYNVRTLAAMIPPGYWGLLDFLIALLLVGSVLAALIGIIAATMPSMLRDIEKSTNRWIATDHIAKSANEMHNFVDQYVLRHGKVAGAVMVIGGLFILINLAPLLWRVGLKF